MRNLLAAAALFSFLGAAPAVAQHPWGSTPCPPDQPSPSYGTDTSTSMQTELSDSVHISGGCIDNTLIGSKVPADATVHNLLVTGTSNIGGGGSTPGGAVGSLQFNNSGLLGGYTIGQSFSTAGGTFNLASGAFAFNVGNLGGDLTGLLPNPTLSVGAASRNVGTLGGGLSGALPNPALVPLAVQTALGPPSGDLGGTGWPNVLVTGLQGFPVSNTPPTPNSSPTWNGSAYVPTVFAPGISQITGDVAAGPGTGSQTATINPGVVTNQKLANEQAGTVKCNSGTLAATPQDCPVNGGLTLVSGALQLDPSIGTSQQLTVGTNCWTITHGIVSSIAAGACTTGTINLTADDGATLLTADDAATLLTADGAAVLTPCATNLVLKQNVSTGCNLAAVDVAMR